MILSTLKQNIRQMVSGAVIKYSKYAKENEGTESTRKFDEYMASFYKKDTFESYSMFPYAVIDKAIHNWCDREASLNGIRLEDEIRLIANNPSKIPEKHRQSVLDAYRELILNNYEDSNNYYRMLSGLPARGSSSGNVIMMPSENIIVPLTVLEEHGIDTLKYKNSNRVVFLHELTDDELYILEIDGYIDELKQKYPSFKYLNYLGHNKVDIIKARQARNFALLKTDITNIPEEVYSTFFKLYEQCREYFTTVIYSSDLSKMHEDYDNFIAFSIMIMTIQRMVNNTFKAGIKREFYDWEFVQNLYKTYNVPFIDTLPMEHHIVLLKNLNNLLRHKSTDKVLLDICSLLGFTNTDIYKYYLVKTHRTNPEGKPIFSFKKDNDGNYILDENGNKVLDTRAMYDFYFQAVDITDDNIVAALQESNKGYRLDYDEVVENDPYWWEDDNLTELQYSTAFNYIETKYLSLNLMYKMTEMLFELSYAFRMMLDKKDEIYKYTISIPKIIPDTKFSIFDIVVFMIALICKKSGFAGNIISDPAKIGTIYGFDFSEKAFKEIFEGYYDENGKWIDGVINNIPEGKERDAIINYFENLKINSEEDVSRLFKTIREYNAYMVEKMRMTSDLKTYNAYKDIFNISMVEENMVSMFSYGTDEFGKPIIAKTYNEYLKHSSPVLSVISDEASKDQISTYIEHIISQLEDFVNELQYTFIISGTDNPLSVALVSLIQFFKSYTTDLAGLNIIYLFDSKIYNLIKFIETVDISANVKLPDIIGYIYSDDIHPIWSKFPIFDEYNIVDKANILSIIYGKDRDKLSDLLQDITSNVKLESILYGSYSDNIDLITKYIDRDDNAPIWDELSTESTNIDYGKDNITFEDSIIIPYTKLSVNEIMNNKYSDNIDNEISAQLNDKTLMHDTIRIISE